jgi:hypothetical protein
VSAGRGDFQRAFDGLLAFHIGEIELVLVRMLENARDVHPCRRNLHFPFEEPNGLA